MLRKIISGGQTGVDRAALDAALALGLEHGGWVPRGRLAEDGPLPPRYALQETQSADYAERTLKNVQEADATLIISRGPLSGGSALTLRLAREYGRPSLHVDLARLTGFQAAVRIGRWLARERIETLNVAGPRASKDPQIYAMALKLLETVFYMASIHAEPPAVPAGEADPLPVTVGEAAERLIAEMALKDRVTVANMAETELDALGETLGRYVLDRFELDGANPRLLESCRWEARTRTLSTTEAALVIVRAAWRRLRRTHKLRIVQ